MRTDLRKKPKQKERYDAWRYSKAEWVKYAAQGLGAGGLIVWLCYHSVYAWPVAVGIALWYLHGKKKQLLEQKKRTLLYHFREFLTALHTALRAGYSLEHAVAAAEQDMEKLYGSDDVLTRELKDIVTQMEVQVPVEKLFWELGERCGVEDIRMFGEILLLSKRTGGNMGKILQNTWRTLCGKIDTRQEMDTLLAARRYEQTVMSLMPAGIILYLRFSFSGFVERLYGNLPGVCVTSVCLLIYALAFCLGRKMTEIEV